MLGVTSELPPEGVEEFPPDEGWVSVSLSDSDSDPDSVSVVWFFVSSFWEVLVGSAVSSKQEVREKSIVRINRKQASFFMVIFLPMCMYFNILSQDT